MSAAQDHDDRPETADLLTDCESDPPDVIEFNEVDRFCPACGEDMVGDDPHAPDCPKQSTTVVDSEQLGVCVDCGESCALHMRRCTWCAALKHLA